MKLGPVTKLDKKNKTMSKNLTLTLCQKIMTSFVIFPIYGQFGAMRKPDSRRTVFKTYIFINSNFLSYKN